MKLTDYIEKHCHSRNAKLAASLEKPVRYDQVSKWIDRNGICIDGVIYCEVARIKGVKQCG